MLPTMLGDVTMVRGKAPVTRSPVVMLVYIIFAAVAVLVFHWLAEGEFSSLLTLSAVFQCMAFSLLGIQAFSLGVRGISAKSLQLDALAIACRLSSTTWLQGYLPADQTGDYLYQVFDALSLAMVLWLLKLVMSDNHGTYDTAEEKLPVKWVAMGCFVLAMIFHADLDDRALFDSLWMCGLFVSAVAVLPQLWMMTHGQGGTPALIGHFVAVMALGRILSGAYMWHAYEELTCEPWIGEFNHALYAILGAHVIHVLFLADFGFFYAKHLATAGLQEPLHLSEVFTV
jgi:hypothetical protein